MKQEKVETQRLCLRPLKMSDYKKWYYTCVNRLPAQNRWDAQRRLPRQCTKESFLKLVASHRKLAKTDDSYWYAIFLKSSGDFIGYIDFDIFVRGSHQFSNFGYQIFNLYWGKGYGQEAAAAGLLIGFNQLKLHRLEAAINLDNKKSIRLVKAIGMRREGIKKRYWYEFGEWVDHLVYVANPEDLGLK